MNGRDIARMRMANQRLAGKRFSEPSEAVAGMVAVQAQDRPAALWAIGLRTRRAKESDVERAVERRSIVRTWPMRGTLHFCAAKDVHWMTRLLAPRAMRRFAGRWRELGLTEGVLARSRRVLGAALSGGQRLTRPQAYAQLEKKGIATRRQRGIHILFRLAQEGMLCMGPQEGKQPTVVLLDDWVRPPRRTMPREEALTELARRYFTSHGPAGLKDFAWWSGLTIADSRAALAGAEGVLRRGRDEGTWTGPEPARPPRKGQAHLLPAFDELLVAYKDRSPSLARVPPGSLRPSSELLSPALAVDGEVVGTWKRALTGRTVRVTRRFLTKIAVQEQRAIAEATQRYGDFLDLEIETR